ncbi:MAG: hypothetical protein HOP21_06890 [Methylotenera sp.]|nr:hypothetical protein [Methylotenera sp.]
MMHPHNEKDQAVTALAYTISNNRHTPISCKFLMEYTHKLLVVFSLYLAKIKSFSIQKVLCPSKPYDELDPKIKNLVMAMNESGGIKTIASCEGHGIRGLYPYVYFKSSVKTASKITKELRQYYTNDVNYLNYTWLIEGKFDQNNNLTFLFYSPELNWASESKFKSLMQFYFFRKKIDQDFHMLQNLLFKHSEKLRECKEIPIC